MFNNKKKGIMKIYVLTIDEVYDYENFSHKPEVFLSKTEAKRFFEREKRWALDEWREEIEDGKYDFVDGKDSFEVYHSGEYSVTHYSVTLYECNA